VRAKDALIIGADHAAALEGRLLGKPGSHEAALRQLRALSGKAADF
jgi:septum formation protein